MNIHRVIAALQRTTHLKTWELRRDYPELFEIEEQSKMEEMSFSTQLAVQSSIAEIRGLACPVNQSFPRMN